MTQVQGYGQPNSRRFTKGPSPIFLAELAETLDLLGLLAEQQASATHTKALKIPTTTKKKKKRLSTGKHYVGEGKKLTTFFPHQPYRMVGPYCRNFLDPSPYFLKPSLGY